jgi:hypothetical protein
MEPTPDEVANVTLALRRLGGRPMAWRSVTDGGYTPARRWVVTLEDGSTAFVKVATDELTASWIRDEHTPYSALRRAAFMPRFIGFHDDGERPVLAIEDLSNAMWPPPWSTERIESVLRCLDDVAATRPPPGLPRASDDHLGLRRCWSQVEHDPQPFLRLGLCSEDWLIDALPALRGAAETAPLDGGELLHFDVRSDNICFRADGRAALVDWNWTSVGNRWLDVAAWLPSLHAEGGPPPQDVAPDVPPGLASVVASYFCYHAGQPAVLEWPHVRAVQLRQARTALPWAAGTLGLTPP